MTKYIFLRLLRDSVPRNDRKGLDSHFHGNDRENIDSRFHRNNGEDIDSRFLGNDRERKWE
jgi:hypothetical protein